MPCQDVLMEPQSAGSPTSPSSPGAPPSENTNLPEPSEEMPPPDEPSEEEAALKPDRQSSSSSSSSGASSPESLFHLDAAEISSPLVAAPDNGHAAPGDGEEVKPDDWASWPERPTQTVDDPFSSDGGAVFAGPTHAPEAQTMEKPDAAAAGDGFYPERIPAAIFQAKSSSQAEWSIASNESLFSIHGAGQSDDLGGLYAGSRSHFDYFYDEAIAEGGGAEPAWKLPTVAEGSEPADAFDAAGGEHGAKEFAMPGSAKSDASGGSSRAKKAMAFRRHESGSGSSSSNFSFAFPILAETSPKKKESAGSALYQPLQKEWEQQQQQLSPPAPMSAFEEMTTEEERRRKTGWCWCGECCGCCWFACSWSSSSCCYCCQWRCWRCDCRCSRPSFCRCNCCLCF